ncbi:MAG: DUF1285 domain-containing protein [Maricaulis sp.]|jgi:hypothetical protein|nr:DUF1285 domain-containing protein [Maricaulis sp.]MDG2044454.1 DUF1285 domain-containing protein [Maricaulis sp.]
MARQTENTNSLQSLVKTAREAGKSLPPVHLWEPAYCGAMDLVIKRDGSWWHEGARITRQPLTRLFSTILRKDDDGVHYLVTPVEKIAIEVEVAPFIAVRVDAVGADENQSLIFTTNFGDVVEAGEKMPISVNYEDGSDEPTPLVRIRDRLDALMSRPVFYELAELAVDKDGVMGVWSDGVFFALEPKN